MLRKSVHGKKYRFRLKSGSSCSPSKSAARMHIKRFGGSGNKAHRAHHKSLALVRIANLVKARAARVARRAGVMSKTGVGKHIRF